MLQVPKDCRSDGRRRLKEQPLPTRVGTLGDLSTTTPRPLIDASVGFSGGQGTQAEMMTNQAAIQQRGLRAVGISRLGQRFGFPFWLLPGCRQDRLPRD